MAFLIALTRPYLAVRLLEKQVMILTNRAPLLSPIGGRAPTALGNRPKLRRLTQPPFSILGSGASVTRLQLVVSNPELLARHISRILMVVDLFLVPAPALGLASRAMATLEGRLPRSLIRTLGPPTILSTPPVAL